ncbi:CRISPR-associated endoribonuclease Cas6 [Alicyclobacillus cycloheptanicus]|uniref:CRISPR-associated endoribonuclease n=1 Tax=Alicyclobacillus cycloheptanicus TaxID=1457 RepID=A0ABT9XLW7_9BACL|nr:CRISPR-associated endoribonuclease Cas6 [Alicyclobacillus cycloheptanicus]MDQ0191301.1 CRISPR-associated endoribonuclease Cas6 [Alicyclobacillus cycloheptanicus]WDM02418.1 CRISPR-associated endoribonuclease Cas6 [Alicyclobacillus cycloheptanicus]
MRVVLEFAPKGALRLPMHYNAALHGVLYRHLSDNRMRDQLHDHGLHRVGSKPVKLFTFSRLMGEYEIDSKEKTITFQGPVRWVVSSAVDQVIYDLSMTLLKAGRISLHGTEVQVRTASLERYSGTVTQGQIRLMSPITVYRTLNLPNGRKYTQYYSPGTPEFTELMRKNLLLKASALGLEVTEADAAFDLIPVDQAHMKERIVLFRDTPVHAWDGNFRVQGTPKMLALAWNAGLCMKNSDGFGLFDFFARGR